MTFFWPVNGNHLSLPAYFPSKELGVHSYSRLAHVVACKIGLPKYASMHKETSLRAAARSYARRKIGVVERVMVDSSIAANCFEVLSSRFGVRDYLPLLREVDYVALGGGADFPLGASDCRSLVGWLCLSAELTAIHVEGIDKPFDFSPGTLVVLPGDRPHCFMHPSVRAFTPSMLKGAAPIEAICLNFWGSEALISPARNRERACNQPTADLAA